MSNTSSTYKVGNETVANTDSFTYLGIVITTDGGAKEDILHRISKAKGAFAQLNKIWNSLIISFKTKLRFFNSNVKTVLLCGCETWLVTEALTNKIPVFVNKCLRRVMKIWCPRSISSDEFLEKCYQLPIANEIRSRK